MGEAADRGLDGAIERLAAAVGQLESAANRVSSGDLLLAGELRDTREANARLAETTRVVGSRLDHTIDKLRILLEG